MFDEIRQMETGHVIVDCTVQNQNYKRAYDREIKRSHERVLCDDVIFFAPPAKDKPKLQKVFTSVTLLPVNHPLNINLGLSLSAALFSEF